MDPHEQHWLAERDTGVEMGLLARLFGAENHVPSVAGRRGTSTPPRARTRDQIPRQEQWRAEAPRVEATWLQPYSLRAYGYLFDVVGESHYQQALETVAGGRTDEGARCPLVTALLVREPRNPHDRHAVRVDVGGQPVGYIPRDDAPFFAEFLKRVEAEQALATCRAWLTGGWDRGGGDRGHFGVRLDLHPDLQLVANAVMLPFGNGRVSVTGEEKSQDYLSELLEANNRVEVIASLEHGNDRITVAIEDQIVGELTGKMSMRYAAWINDLHRADLPVTAEARVIRGERKIEVFLKLARPW